MNMNNLKIFNPFTKKTTTLRNVYSQTAKKIYKYMIMEEGFDAETILPPQLGFNMKNGRFFKVAVEILNDNYKYDPETQIKTYIHTYHDSKSPIKDLYHNVMKVVSNNKHTEYLLQIKHTYRRLGKQDTKNKFFAFAKFNFDYDEVDGMDIEEFSNIISKNLPSPDSSTNLQILMSFMNVLPIIAGGCRCKNPKTFKIGDFKCKSPVSSNNNCFFACVKEELGITGIKTQFKTDCNRIRLKYGLEYNTEIPINIAIKILEDVGLTCCIYNGEYDFLTGDKDGVVSLMLIDNHYLRITMKSKKKLCNKCNLSYVNIHSESHCVERMKFLKFKSRSKSYLTKPREIKNKYNKNNQVLHYDIESHRRAVGMNTNNPYYEQMPFIVGFVFKNFYKEFTGKDCMEKFYKFIISLGKDEVKYINAYNGSNYDHYFLWREHMKTDNTIEMKDLLINNGSIISATIKGKFNSVKLIDLNKHLTGSLRDNLENTGCQISKGEIDYDKFTCWNKMDKDLKKKTREYLKADVLGLQELYEKTNDDIYNRYGRNVCDFLTLSSMGYDIWRETIEEDQIALPTHKEELFFRKSIYGGRCYKNAHKFKSNQYNDIKKEINNILNIVDEEDRNEKIGLLYKGINDYVFDADVVSLYPTAMANNVYPIGKPIGTEKYQKGKLGIYKVNYTAPKDLVYPYLPRRDIINDMKNSTKPVYKLNWDLNDGESCYYTSVDIENAKKLGYKFKIFGGYYWEQTADLFSKYVDMFIKLKNQLKKDGKKNSCEYLTTKLFLNALYGKMLQKPIHDKSFYVANYDELIVKMGEFTITEIEQVGKRWICKGISKNPNQKETDITKPTYLGAFILSYSRSIMMNYTLQTNPNNEVEKMFYYTDTDALHINSSLLKNVKLSTELGGLDDDVGGKIIRAVWVAPKLYGYEYITPMGDIKYHIKGKGIKLGNTTNKDMDFQDLMDMSNGAEKSFGQDINFKKTNNKLTAKESNDGLNIFTITTTHNTTKVINRTKWSGRKQFYIHNKDGSVNDNFLVPHGYYTDKLIL